MDSVTGFGRRFKNSALRLERLMEIWLFCKRRSPSLLGDGLVKARTIDVLQVFWPSGEISRFAHVAANRVLTIREKEGLQP